MPRTSASVLMTLAAITMTGCGPMNGTAGAIEAQAQGPVSEALCRAWGDSLPTRSRADTGQTALEIERGYEAFAAACPQFERLVPGGAA